MAKGVSIEKHIKIQQDTITPKDKRKKTYLGREYIVINRHKYFYVSTYGNASAAYDVADTEYSGLDWIIIPYGGWGNPALPALFVADII